MKIKKFNESSDFDMDNFIFKDVFGELSDYNDEINKTDKGVYTNISKKWYDKLLNYKCKMYVSDDGSALLWGSDDPYVYEVGHVYLKDGYPFILSSINGDDRGCIVFNNVFVSCGHDGQVLFNTQDPTDFKEN